ncbi:hypothetical protein [Paenibacillus qinlingensis]|uniref:Photosystem II stability/assembly factor-like uncharacterized protein n=1 Tax=Paenibacillus qinlingensis TaxID=1837343 RepID=A0ABU1NXC3_9BACL|nr:hypothetical protein [Paenibacillus qinlingensis]MDR6552138.1 photosystem II stability/assembly factor-like uncharacterized protein [Paenibacillus qinlingensis]
MLKRALLLLAITTLALTGCKSSGQTSGNVTVSDSPSPRVVATTETTTSLAAPGSAAPTVPAKGSEGTSTTRLQGVTAVRLADAEKGWIGGKGWIARTDDGGVKWKVQYTGAGDIGQLFALNDQDAWATEEAAAKLLSTHDGGAHWSAVGTVPNQAFLHFVSKQEAYSGNAQTVDGGVKWKTLPVPDGITGDVYYHDSKNGWAVRQVKDTIEVLRTQDGGQNWKTVMSRPTVATLTGAVIRSAGVDDAWVELIGESGMTQTSYSLFHTRDGGKTWQTVLVNSTAGGGPAPGFPVGDTSGPKNTGSKPGPLYVVNTDVAFMGGSCPACDKPNSVGWTKDGGKTWVNGTESFTGYGELLLGMADANSGWLITNDHEQPSVMYTTRSGGVNWNKVHTFDAP